MPEVDAPAPALRQRDVVGLVLGIVIGAGIFRTPPAVAAGSGSAAEVLGAWIAGGVVSLAGALCYAELASTWPHAGGEYHFLSRAFGRPPAFLFAWARMTVIPTGSVALLGFVFGDYVDAVLPVRGGSATWAALMVGLVVALNVLGLRPARTLQNVLTAFVVVALLGVAAVGLLAAPRPPAPPSPQGAPYGLAMVFVLLAYGGWNEAAYVSAELRGGRRAIARPLLLSMAAVSGLYVLANAGYLRAFGLDGLRRSEAPAAELLGGVLGPAAGVLVALVVAAAALTSANATVLMGSRMTYALGREHPLFGPLGRWSARAAAPVNAVLLQGAISLALVLFGAASRRGFETMVAYTAPVFWGFFLLTGASVVVLRTREPAAERPFAVPLYPLTPAIFCAACAWLLGSSIAYAGPGALLGLAVLASGAVPLWLSSRRAQARRPATT